MSLKSFKIVTFIIAFILIVIIWTRPCIMHPFSTHDAWEWGFREGYGDWPDSLTKAKYDR